jgi:protein phosphatase methylesterase 1
MTLIVQPLQLLGHSMGASPIISSAPILQQKGYKISGVVVLDVVEGEANRAQNPYSKL